ncbi:MAG: ABC transporter permease [Candidatus Omnitrophica bacterium]|nr:ABC transporter permease [Candidatus Omnitrophota bacterium]
MNNEILKNKQVLFGLVVIIIMYSAAIFAPIIATHNPNEIHLEPNKRLLPPSRENLLGTDDLGRDLFARMLYGARISLSIGFIAVLIMLFIGVVLGVIAGYYGGWVDSAIMRLIEVMLCFPTFYLILMILAFLGPSIVYVMIVIGVTSWMGLARLVRAEFLSLREREFVVAARVLGASDRRIAFRHILPNALAPVFVSATLSVGGAILLESGLSFLGLGVQIPTPSWGNIISTGRFYIDSAWWLTLFPGLAILMTVLSFYLVGEGLRTILDPRLQRL